MPYTSQELRQRYVELEQNMRLPGSVLFSQARYEIVRQLGAGGMGVTVLAYELSAADLKRPVVLKFVKDSLDPHHLAEFLKEVQLSVLFSHPNLISVYRLESEIVQLGDGHGLLRHSRRARGHTVYYSVMQYIDGWNLRQIVDRLRQVGILLNQDISVYSLARVARGLHYVHEYKDDDGEHLGLVHRDVSPENILVDRFGRIKVTDFGIATAAKRGRGSDLVQAGNLRYCAPEQLSGARVDRRCDIYNIGLLMYLLFTNTDRFAPEVRERDARDRIRRKMARSVLPDLSHTHPRSAAICARCLAEDPAERYQTCEDLANDLDLFLQERQRVVTNDQIEEMLHELFSPNPQFVSPRFVPLTGSAALGPEDFDPAKLPTTPEPAGPVETTLLPPGTAPGTKGP
jgi:serine/threonine-protein kinase